MNLFIFFAVLVTLLLVNANKRFDKKWIVEVKDASAVHEVARASGCRVVEQIELQGYIFLLACKPSTQRLQTGRRGRSLILRSEYQRRRSLVLKSDVRFNDYYYDKQWYLRGKNYFTMDVQEAWKDGYTGKGVRISIVDNGVEGTHPDLVKAFDRDASLNLLTFAKEDKTHGTPVAGIIAAQPNNSLCTVGIAYGSKISSTTIFGNQADYTDFTVMKALSHRNNITDIYSNSWGPPDEGWIWEGPGYRTERVLENGVTQGRNGLGNIYFFAAGNGAHNYDNCAYDGYVNSPYIMGISGISNTGHVPSYVEGCSAVMAATPTLGTRHGAVGIATTNVNGQCMDNFSGTSASCPMASSAAALTLEANPNITWRDMQHIIALTATQELCDHRGKIINSKKFELSYYCGFGVMSAHRMTSLAKLWTTVPEQLKESIGEDLAVTLTGNRKSLQVDMYFHAGEIKYLESVLLSITGSFSNRGAFTATVKSPSGTECLMIPKRLRDGHKGESNLQWWPQKSIFFWGENPKGHWIVKFQSADQHFIGRVKKATLIFYGTSRQPVKIRVPKTAPAWMKMKRHHEYFMDSEEGEEEPLVPNDGTQDD